MFVSIVGFMYITLQRRQFYNLQIRISRNLKMDWINSVPCSNKMAEEMYPHFHILF